MFACNCHDLLGNPSVIVFNQFHIAQRIVQVGTQFVADDAYAEVREAEASWASFCAIRRADIR